LAPFDAWLLLRGLRTLSLRVNQINVNALALAHWLERHPHIAHVGYCGLPSHPQHELAKKPIKGFTGMLCVEVAGAAEREGGTKAQTVLVGLERYANAGSVGGVGSLAVRPAGMGWRHLSPEQMQKAGSNVGMLRISVGIE